MNNLSIFKNEKFGAVRTVQDNGETKFIANDIAKALGYQKPRNAVSKFCKKGAPIQGVLTPGGNQTFIVIPESDVYRLTFKSNLPEADVFVDWIAEEVIPSIRKTGSYQYDSRIKQLTSENEYLTLKLEEASTENKMFKVKEALKHFGKPSATNNLPRTKPVQAYLRGEGEQTVRVFNDELGIYGEPFKIYLEKQYQPKRAQGE